MSRKPDPQKAIYLKPNQHTLKKEKKQERPQSQWQPHQGNVVYDDWGTAIRAMRAQGVSWE